MRMTEGSECAGLMRTGSPVNAMFKGQQPQEYAWFAISDSLPLTSINVERAARQIIAHQPTQLRKKTTSSDTSEPGGVPRTCLRQREHYPPGSP
jgi:hypothetical protein